MMRSRIRRTRVLIVDYTSALWGAERVALELGPRLSQRGVDVWLACPQGGAFPAAWRAEGLTHVPLELPAHHGIRGPTGGRPAGQLIKEAAVMVRSALGLARLARDVDVLHSTHQWSHVDVAVAGKIARRPVVLHVHDILPRGLGRWLLVQSTRLSAVTLTACEAIAQPLGGSGRNRLQVFYPALDLKRYRPGPPDATVRTALGGGSDDCLVGIVGRLDPVKGIEVLIHAMAGLEGKARRSRLAVVGAPYEGSSEYVSELRALAERQLGERVRFVGFRDDIPAVLRSLDVLVNASHKEPFGTIVLEAQACGTAVIATMAGGVGEHVEHGETGFMVPPDDPRALREVLTQLVVDVARRRAVGAAARRMVEERFDVEKAAEFLAEMYREQTRS